MAKYLDYAGLQYLWTKIKNYVSTQPLGANVRYDAQTLTTAQQEQARKNIAAGGSNENLLDNGWFTVNSRGKSTYSSGVTSVDRWGLGLYVNVTVTSNGLTIANTDSARRVFQQLSTTLLPYVGKTVTMSILLQDGTVVSGTNTVPSSGTTDFVTVTGQTVLRLTNNSTNISAILFLQANSTINVRAIKVEAGSYSTLANDVPPDYATELSRCIYSKADPADTYANNGFGRTNPNLLDNPWFTVNQRGTSGTISTANIYTVDRWKLSGGSVTISANGISLLKVGSTQGAYREYIEYDRIKTNEQYTLSVMLQSGEVYSVAGTITPQTAQSGWLINKNFTSDLWGGIRAYGQTADLWDICFTSNNTSGVAIRAVKLELGSVSTLANDTPPDYGTELAKCQRYYYRATGATFLDIGTALAESATALLLKFDLPVPMRVAPTTSTSGTWTLWNGGVGNAVTGISTHTTVTPPTNCSYVYLKATSSGMTQSARLNIQARNQTSAYIEFSADL